MRIQLPACKSLYTHIFNHSHSLQSSNTQLIYSEGSWNQLCQNHSGMDWSQALPLGGSRQGKSAMVNAKVATHDYTQTYETGIPCYRPSPARSPLPGLEPGVFRSRCIRQKFLELYRWLRGYSGLWWINGSNSSQHSRFRVFAIWLCHPFHLKEDISPALDDQFSHVSPVECWSVLYDQKLEWKVLEPSFSCRGSSPLEHTQAGLLVLGEDKTHQEQSRASHMYPV